MLSVEGVDCVREHYAGNAIVAESLEGFNLRVKVLHCLTDDELVDVLSDPMLKDEEKTSVISSKCKESSDNNTAWLIPIADVEGITEPSSDPCVNMSQTKRLQVDRKGTEEIESVRLTPHQSLKEWFKKIFN